MKRAECGRAVGRISYHGDFWRYLVDTNEYIKIFMVIAILFSSFGFLSAVENIVLNSKSDYVINYGKDAPSSVVKGAKELQHYIEKATGAKIKIVPGVSAGKKIINLGFSKAAGDAGLAMDGIKTDGYRIVLKNGNIYIYGNDTPDGQFTEEGGFSRATLFGVYAFLERFLGIRWIMPGEIGEIIPEQKTFSVPENLDLIENPVFQNRVLGFALKGKKNEEWLARQRLGESRKFYVGHVWHKVFTPELAEKHPEWFAEIGGKRIKPSGDMYKVCTSNPELIKYMADYLCEVFRNDPERKGFSVSPTDGGGFCQCENCRKLDDVPLPEEDGRKYTRRMLIFYNQVAKLLAEKYPDKRACGYVYQYFEFPPVKMDFTMNKNVYLVWAPATDYGVRHYVPEIKKRWHETLKEWKKITSGHFGYYDLPNIFYSSVKIPSPPCRAIMNDIMHALKQEKPETVLIYGTKNMESGGIINYVNARMLWNPDLDADALAKEYCDLAYGDAGSTMKALYDFLEEKYQKYMIENPEQSYEISPKAMREIYADNFAILERFYKDASVRLLTFRQRERLDMFSFDMIRLYRYLKAFGWLKNTEKSIFDVSEAQYKTLCRERGVTPDEVKLEEIDREIICRNFEFSPLRAKTAFKERAGHSSWYRNTHVFAVRADADGEISIPVATRAYRTPMVSYIVYTSGGDIIVEGTIPGKGEIKFFGREGVVYFIRANAGTTGYNLDFGNLKHAAYSGKLSARHGEGFHLFGGDLPLPMYFVVPDKTKKFTISLTSGAPSETASAILYNPDGKKVGELKTLKQQNTSLSVDAGEYAGKIWKLEFVTPETGVWDDAWVNFGEGLSGWFSFSPSLLSVEEKGPKN